MSGTTNTAGALRGLHQIVRGFEQHGEDMEVGVGAELDYLADATARKMRELAPKGINSHLVQSILPRKTNTLVREIGPSMSYSEAVEGGVKPGGKGLPRFFDPAAASIVAWLESKAFKGLPRVRLGTGRYTAREPMLRDRYEGLAWHIRHKGTKAQPFVEPTHKFMEPIVLSRMELAVRRVLAKRPDTSTGAAGDGALA